MKPKVEPMLKVATAGPHPPVGFFAPRMPSTPPCASRGQTMGSGKAWTGGVAYQDENEGGDKPGNDDRRVDDVEDLLFNVFRGLVGGR